MTGFYDIEHLRKHYDPHEQISSAAIDVSRLEIPLGGIIAIVGGSGCGKTTLLNLMGGLEAPDVINDRYTTLNLQLPGEKQLYKLGSHARGAQGPTSFPRRQVSYVFQQGYLLHQASLGLNLAMTRRGAGLVADRHSLEALLELAQLNDVPGSSKQLSDRAGTLSGGQQQRVNIARALGREPSLIFADELSSGLDPEKARDVMIRLRQWVWAADSDHTAATAVAEHSRLKLNRCLLWVTHDYELASDYADAVIVLTQGALATNCLRPIELSMNQNGYADKITAGDLLGWVKSGAVPVHMGTPGELSGTSLRAARADTDVTYSTETATPSGVEPQPFVSNRHRNTPQISNQEMIRKSASAPGLISGNLGSGIALSWMEAYPPMQRSKQPLLNFMFAILRPFLGFSHWVRALQLAAILSLIAIVVYGQTGVIRFFDEQLHDPTLRHVVVNQSLHHVRKSRIDDASLASLSTVINSFSQTKAPAEPVAFGRHTEYVDVYPADFTGKINSGYVSEITVGIIERKEPVYAQLAVYPLDPDQPGCNRSKTVSPAELIQTQSELSLIVTSEYIETARTMFDIDLCEKPYVEFDEKGERRTFQIVGFVDTAPADGYTYFDALLQVGNWKTWLSLSGKSSRDYYQRAAVYFTQTNLGDVMNELRSRAFAFDREIITKFERLMATATQLRNTFLVITWLTLVVAATVAAGLIWSYLSQNAKSIAVLRAHDAWLWPLVAAIPFQLLLTFLYSLGYIILAVSIWNLLNTSSWFRKLVEIISDGTWQPENITFALIQPAVPWLLSSLLAILVVGWLCLAVWRVTHRKLAHELRQAY